jgi:K+-transporting ATPase ATPase C chain
MKANSFLSELRISLLATLGLVILLCGVYPLTVWGIAQLLFPGKANGSLLRNTNGEIVGSSLLAQAFDDSVYFHPRPSAAGNGYDAANSGGSNLGPTSQKLMDQIKQRAEDFRRENGLPQDAIIPEDAVTASASGLDPHITPANAAIQAIRVARARAMTITQVQRLIAQNTDKRAFGILGEDGVNVLKLNIALDRTKP